MATFNAATTADLLSSLRLAADGDTILLAPGTYSAVTLSAINKSGNVTVTSADASHPAVLTDLAIRNSSGLTFSALELFGTKDAPFQVLASSRIVLDRLDVHGTLNGSSSDDYRGMVVRDSSYVTVSNSYFREFTSALSHTNSQYLAFTGNSFETIRDDGIAGGGSSNVTISGNTFTNFDHVGEVHPDAIQFWTAGTSTAASNITIAGNVFARGTGAAIQGIFLNDEVGTLAFRNVSIIDNAIIGAMYNGIAVYHADGLAISGNIVLGASDQASWIGAGSITAGTMADNVASSYSIGAGVQSSGDVLASSLTMADLANVSASPLSASVAAAMQHAVADLGNAALPPGVNLIGFIDGASPTGLTYAFAEVRVDGSGGNDVLRAGSTGAYHLYGYDGNDSLVGSRNGIAATLEGGKGNDVYTIYQPQDVIVEGPDEGSDTVYSYISYTLGTHVESLRAMAGGLTLTGNGDANGLVAHADGSILYGLGGDDNLQGAAGNDRLFGGEGNDRMTGGGGDDYLEGGAGNDTILGGDGNDTILGGDGNDSIEGGAGIDTLTGGSGADSFVYRDGHFTAGNLAAGTDVITDFNAAEGDRISLSVIDANTATAADDMFVFIGNQAFRGIAGDLRFAADGDGITVYGDTDGDKVADLAIHLVGVTSISAGNFFL